MAALSEAAPARGDVAAVRSWWREARPGTGLGHKLDLAYTVALATGILGALAYGTAKSVLASWITPDAIVTYGPATALAILVLGARWGAYQGPVVFSVPDVATLLGAPLSRRRLATPRLLRSLAGGALVGIVVAAVVIVGLAGDGRGIATGRAAGLLLGGALLGILTIAAAAGIERSARAERISRLTRWPLLAAAAGLAVWSSSGETGAGVVSWSGPWGWATRSAEAGSAGSRLLALGLLAALTLAAGLAALRAIGRVPAERHMRRAEARAGVRAALYSFDARSVRQSLRGGASAAPARSSRLLPRPRNPALAIPWRDAVAFLAVPHQAAEGAILSGAGAALSLLGGGKSAAVVGALVLYVGTARMLEPLRAELDAPSRPKILVPAPLGRLLTLHTIVPMAISAVAVAAVALGCALAGSLPDYGGLRVLLLVGSVPAVVLCAALSARRGGRMPLSLLASGSDDPLSGGIPIVAWLLAWPIAAAIAGGVPGLLVAHGVAFAPAAMLAVAGPAILRRVLRATRSE